MPQDIVTREDLESLKDSIENGRSQFPADKATAILQAINLALTGVEKVGTIWSRIKDVLNSPAHVVDKTIKIENKAIKKDNNLTKKELSSAKKNLDSKLKDLDKEIKREKNGPALAARKKEKAALLKSYDEKVGVLKEKLDGNLKKLTSEGIYKRKHEEAQKINPSSAYNALRGQNGAASPEGNSSGGNGGGYNEPYSSYGRAAGDKQSIWDEILHGSSKAANLTPQKTAAQSEILGHALNQLRGNKFDFAPIEQKARTNFGQNTIPSIAERFTSGFGKGGSARKSSAFQQSLGQAGAGLEESLAALKSEHAIQQQGLNQDLFRYGLAPLEVNTGGKNDQGLLGNLRDLAKDPNSWLAAGGFLKDKIKAIIDKRSANKGNSPNKFKGGQVYTYNPNQGNYYQSPEGESMNPQDNTQGGSYNPPSEGSTNLHAQARNLLYPTNLFNQ